MIFRRIELLAEILGLAEPYQLLGQLHRVLDMYVVVDDAVQDEQLRLEPVCVRDRRAAFIRLGILVRKPESLRRILGR